MTPEPPELPAGPGQTMATGVAQESVSLSVWAVLLVPLALATVASAYVPLKLPSLLLVFSLGVGLAGILTWVSCPTHSMRLAPWSTISLLFTATLILTPAWRMAVAPGADQAMYSAIARGITSARVGLSPAWGNVMPVIYPRGFPLLIATVTILSGPTKASLIAAGLSLVLFAVALGLLFRALGLGRHSTAYAAALVLVCRVPQVYFGSGSNATTLAFAYGFLAGASLLTAGVASTAVPIHVGLASLFALAAMATHPIGALAALSVGIAAALLKFPRPSLRVLLPPLAAAALFALIAHRYGPQISPDEARWIRAWIRDHEAVAFRARTPSGGITARLLAFAAQRSGTRISRNEVLLIRAFALGPEALVFVARTIRNALWGLQAGLGGLFFALATSGVVVGSVVRRWRPLSLVSMGAFLAFCGFEVVGPRLPLLGILAYAVRWLPALAVALAMPVCSIHAALPLRAQRITLALLLLLGVGCNYLWFQTAVPMATDDDLRVIACLDRLLPRERVIDGAYGDATQWVPALTGRLVTRAHVHISLFDEVRTRLSPLASNYRFVGSRLVYGDPAPEASVARVLCRSGDSRLEELAAPVAVAIP